MSLLIVTTNLAGQERAAASDYEYAGIHSVAVISLLGDDVDMQAGGVTRFGNHDYILHTDWNLDAQIAGEVATALKERFLIRDGALDSRAFPKITADFLHDPATQVQRALATLPQSTDLDAYVIVFPQSFGGIGMDWQGLAVTRGQGLFGPGTTSIEAYYEVAVYNARTLRRIDSAAARFEGSHSPPVEMCSNSLWGDSADQLSDEQKSRVRTEFESLIDRSLFYTLSAAGLMGSADAAVAAAKGQRSGDPSCHAP